VNLVVCIAFFFIYFIFYFYYYSYFSLPFTIVQDFFNQINILYGNITDFCSPQTCEVMSAGPKYVYLWADGQIIKKPIKVSAPEYVDYLMTCESLLLLLFDLFWNDLVVNKFFFVLLVRDSIDYG
jgi:hypothetical protein